MISISGAIAGLFAITDPTDKVMAARRVARDWRLGRLAHAFETPPPLRPARGATPELRPASQMPRRRKGSSLTGRVALLHAFAHIEYVAIDLAFDMAARFGDGQPRAFIDDWLRVGADEALHFALLDRRLRQLGSHYGALPAHDGLWEAAQATAHDRLARLAVVPLVLEARGLDVSPATIARLQTGGDAVSARILTRIYADEIRHVRIGHRWFVAGCESRAHDPVAHWRAMVKRHFNGAIKPPFNDSARESAGLTRAYYETLVTLSPPGQ